jgi:hypothetical protein
MTIRIPLACTLARVASERCIPQLPFFMNDEKIVQCFVSHVFCDGDYMCVY